MVKALSEQAAWGTMKLLFYDGENQSHTCSDPVYFNQFNPERKE